MSPADVDLALWSAVWPPCWAFTYTWIIGRLTGRRLPHWVTAVVWGVPMVPIAAAFLAIGQPLASAASALNAIAALIWWWLSRRRKRRAAAWLSEKFRFVRDRMVQTMRDRAKPRPVFRPSPGGAR
jgi:hypothetical protein